MLRICCFIISGVHWGQDISHEQGHETRLLLLLTLMERRPRMHIFSLQALKTSVLGGGRKEGTVRRVIRSPLIIAFPPRYFVYLMPLRETNCAVITITSRFSLSPKQVILLSSLFSFLSPTFPLPSLSPFSYSSPFSYFLSIYFLFLVSYYYFFIFLLLFLIPYSLSTPRYPILLPFLISCSFLISTQCGGGIAGDGGSEVG